MVLDNFEKNPLLRLVDGESGRAGSSSGAQCGRRRRPRRRPGSRRLPRDARDSRMKIFSGTANRSLSQEIAAYLGVDLGKILIKGFADGEIYVQLQEIVRGCDVFLVQPICSPVNKNLMELFIMIDACRRASTRSITVGNVHVVKATRTVESMMRMDDKLRHGTMATDLAVALRRQAANEDAACSMVDAFVVSVRCFRPTSSSHCSANGRSPLENH
uniref:ribose-phosphate diphosphokinase n=1 Tax=Setaria viridis TaxID=4556 RepID=A0A4V6DB60_SETVI|nr:hypothetical protein SEVIR_2G189900v2 [Setaria viridis]